MNGLPCLKFKGTAAFMNTMQALGSTIGEYTWHKSSLFEWQHQRLKITSTKSGQLNS